MRSCVGFVLLCVALLTACTRPPATAPVTPQDGAAWHWHDIAALGVQGRAWPDTATSFERLPARARAVLSPQMWLHGQHTAGLYVGFSSNSTALRARWSLRGGALAMHHMPASGVSGLDLYVKSEGAWRWLATGIPRALPDNEVTLVADLPALVPPAQREYRLYLPLYNGVASARIGVAPGATLAATPAAADKPVVVYGTSIVQGAVASRPGLAYPAQLGRRLARPVLNLGFSGQCRMEPEMVALLTEIHAAAFVVDCLANMPAAEIEARTLHLVTTLRRAHPRTLIVLLEHFPYADAHLRAVHADTQLARNQALRAAVAALAARGIDDVVLVPTAQALLEADGVSGADDLTVDGIHPNDRGMLLLAGVVAKVLTALLPRPQP